MWSLDGTTVQMTIKKLGLQQCFTAIWGFLSLFGFSFFGAFFCGLRGFFPICKILLQFVPYKYMYPRWSLSENCSSLSACEISKSTCSCPAAAASLGTLALSCPRPHWGLSMSPTLLATPACLIPFFPFLSGNERQGLAALYLGQWHCYKGRLNGCIQITFAIH